MIKDFIKEVTIVFVLALATVMLMAVIGQSYLETSSQAVVNLAEIKNVERVILQRKIDKLVEEHYRSLIPSKYFDIFWTFTAERPELRSEIYAIMKWESGNFRRTGYGPRNANGSYDYGIMQINSYNLESEYFVKKYGPKENEMKYIKSYHDKTIVMGIKYYIDLKDRYGKYAAACYNGGPRAARLLSSGVNVPKGYKKFVNTVSRYLSQINKISKSVNDMLDSYDLFNINKRQANLMRTTTVLLN